MKKTCLLLLLPALLAGCGSPIESKDTLPNKVLGALESLQFENFKRLTAGYSVQHVIMHCGNNSDWLIPSLRRSMNNIERMMREMPQAGISFDLVSSTPLKTHQFKRGERQKSCYVKQDFLIHDMKLKFKVSDGSRSMVEDMSLSVLEHSGKFYIIKI